VQPSGDPFTALFSESPARAVVAVRPGSEAAFASLREAHRVPGQTIGRTGGSDLVIEGSFAVPLAELAAAHAAALPGLFG